MKISLILVFILTGFTSLVSQSLILRETLITFQGNELTLGLVLANWIILTALGSKLFSKASIRAKNPVSLYALFQIVLSLYIPLSIIFIRILTNILGLASGEGTGIFSVFASMFLILAPLNILLGAMFPLACHLWSCYSKKSEESAGIIFMLEAVGFVTAGPVFTFLFISHLDSFQITFILGLLNLAAAIIILNLERGKVIKRLLITFAVCIFLSGILAISFGLTNKIQNHSLNKQWWDNEVLECRNTVYGNLTLVKRLQQYTIFSNGIPVISAPHSDSERIESLVHFAMLTATHSENVLILGGGLGGTIAEALKYPLINIDYVELDPALIEMAKLIPSEMVHKELTDSHVNIKNIDANRFLRKTKVKYDIIILNLP
ncbi:MAG: hypothetical protein NTZ48_04660, partial [Candidatus Omnitrophica bacterium]|nr:hypothetical protein [Candidatus Omnitrophota bacterium]